ncbi:SusC/RagA family TonB-linked outer membrane protein [Chitinophagaceae bacterium MMS25-I14]
MKQLLLTLGVLLVAITVQAQTKKLKGTVVSSDRNETLIGVNIQVKGGGQGTVSDANGKFTLDIPDTGNVVLSCSYLGYLRKDVQVAGKDEIVVKLTPDDKSLNEVVVVGYQTVKRKDLTAAVSSVNAQQLKDVPVNSAAQALTGRLAGVQVTTSEGSPDADVQIKIRGGGSITQDNSPLYVVDGVEVENGLNSLSPQDIESVDVLKDASATSIYGARGANGVVIITTKRGKAGKTKVNYNGSIGFKKLSKTLSTMSPYDYVLYQYERSRGNSSDSTSFSQMYGSTFDTLSAYKNVPGIDWQDIMFGRSALMQTHNVSVSGGNSATQYNLGITSNQEQGIMQLSDYNRKLISFKFDHKFNDKFKISFNSRYNNTQVTGAGTASPGSSATNNLRQSIRYRPFLTSGQDISTYDFDYASETSSNGLSLVNPVLLNQSLYRKNYTSLLNLSGSAQYNLMKGLVFKTTAGYDYTSIRQNTFDDTITYYARFYGGGAPIAAINTITRGTFTNTNLLTYTNAYSKGSWAKKNSFDALLGQEIYENKYKSYDQESHGFPAGISADQALGNMSYGTPVVPTDGNPQSNEYTERIASFFGRANYAYDSKYLVTASLRADGSSKFAEGHQWGYFPSAALAWRASNESFLNFIKPVVSDLKFRLSYGAAGNNRITNFLYMTQYAPNVYYGLDGKLVSGVVANALANPNLTWETTVSRNFGVDVSFLKGRLSFTGDIYQNTISNLLIAAPIPPSSGYISQMQNVGATENKGVEFQLTAIPVRTKDFNWNVTYNMSFNRNVVKNLGNNESYFYVNSGWMSNAPADYIVRVGDQVGSMWGLVSDGYYKLSDFDYNPTTKIYTLKNGVASSQKVTSQLPMPGGLKYKDINGDGIIDDKDRTVIGHAAPKFYGGLNQQFTYKGFDLSIFVNFQYGGQVYNYNKLEFNSAYTTGANMLSDATGRWKTIDANGNVIERVVTIGGTQYVQGESPDVLAAANKDATMWIPLTTTASFYPSSYAVEDASFIRINNITLGYTLPSKWLKRAKVEQFRVYFTVNNLAVITGYSGYDPEVNTRRATPMTPGVDYSAYPRSRTYLWGVNLTF